MQLDHARKTMVVSFTFLELGQQHVSDGTAWLTPICLRTTKIDQVPVRLRAVRGCAAQPQSRGSAAKACEPHELHMRQSAVGRTSSGSTSSITF